jgi:serine/threonine protein kinase/TolB-like protein/Flp pilus assembly protein TadD
MDRERWQQIDTIFKSALECAPSDRPAFLDEACRSDISLRSEVESLIAHDQARSFMDNPGFEDAARLLTHGRTGSLLGQTLGPYKILGQIGAGGMGEVYLALHTTTNRKVALKLLPPYLIKDEQRAWRFRQEARAVLALNHPNIVTIYDIGQAGDIHFIATEFIEGETLRQRMERAPLEINEALDIAIQVAGALAAAHKAGVVHRDIKPENIMLRPDGYVKVLDFGLAKLTERYGLATASAIAKIDTEPGLVMGTATYMSPEQARGLPVDARTDIWSLGVVLYEMVAGRAPFEGATPTDVIISIVENEPAPLVRYTPAAPAHLELIIKTALAKNVEQRFHLVTDLLIDLRIVKRELEIKAELERAALPELRGAETATRNGSQTTVENLPEPLAHATRAATATTTPRAKYLVGVIKRHSTAAIIIAITLTLAIAALTYFYFARPNRAPVKSIAVLPFVNNSVDPATEYLSDGITESLINSLSQLPTLRVMARSTAFSYKGRAVDPRKAGRELGVDAVLMGRVSQRGDALSIQAELVNVADGSQLWGEQYNRTLSDVLAIQQEISTEISERLRLKITGEEQRRVTRHSTKHTEAYQLYLKGRYHWNKRTDEGFRRAIEYFLQAIERDPSYALAYVGLADSFLLSELLPARERYPKAKAAAQRALEIDETLGEAHTSLAAIKNWYDFDWSGAEIEFRRAIELSPNYPTAHHWYGELLANLGRFEESVAEYQRALELDPLSLAISTDFGMVYYHARQYDRAIEQLRKVIEIDPNYVRTHFYLAQVYEEKGMFEEALAELERGSVLEGDSLTELANGKAAIRNAFRSAGARGYWRMRLQIVKEEVRKKKRVYFMGSSTDLAILHARAGERDQAFEWFEKVYQDREPSLLWLKVAPDCDNLRSDPRFTNLLKRVNFPV